MNEQVCGHCSWWIMIDCEDIELSDTESKIFEFGVCSNCDGEYYDGYMWRNVNNHGFYMRLCECSKCCRKFDPRTVSK